MNKKIGRLEPPFLLEEQRLEFISTMGGKSFHLDPGSGIQRNVWFKDDNEGTEIIVAHSIREFFFKFLGKVDTLLTNFDPKKQVLAYFEDEDTPVDLSKW